MPASNACSCGWAKALGSADNCSPQKSGMQRTGVWICDDQWNAVTIVAPSTADAKSGAISDITLLAGGSSGFAVYAREDTVLINFEASVADNGTKQINETVQFKANIDNNAINWAEAHLDKWGYLIFEDAEGKLWAVYCKLNQYAGGFGGSSTDERALTLDFVNTKKHRLYPIDLTITGTYANNSAFITYLTTPTI